jgi:hypothetical protein
LVAGRDLKDAQGEADLVIEVLRTGRAAEPAFQDGMDHLPRGGLADAAGHGNHGPVESLPMPGGPLPEGILGIVDLEDPAVGRSRNGPPDDGPCRPAGKRFFGEIGPVVVLARNRPENAARLGLAAIDHDGPERANAGLAAGSGGGLQWSAQGLL